MCAKILSSLRGILYIDPFRTHLIARPGLFFPTPIQITCILAISLYEYDPPSAPPRDRSSLGHAYEALLIVAILLALVVVVVTCLNNANLTGKTYLVGRLARGVNIDQD